MVKNKADDVIDNNNHAINGISMTYLLILTIVALKNIHTRCNNKSVRKECTELMVFQPNVGVLGCLDVIFEYFTIEDLQKVARV